MCSEGHATPEALTLEARDLLVVAVELARAGHASDELTGRLEVVLALLDRAVVLDRSVSK